LRGVPLCLLHVVVAEIRRAEVRNPSRCSFRHHGLVLVLVAHVDDAQAPTGVDRT
jgi:hypothetical protein